MEDPGQDALYLRPGADDGLESQAMDTYDVEAAEFVFIPGDIVRRYAAFLLTSALEEECGYVQEKSLSKLFPILFPFSCFVDS